MPSPTWCCMAKVFWLASYPKSGNTWLRLLLTNYLRDAGTPVDINDCSLGPIVSSRAWFDEWAGVEASMLEEATIDQLRPAVLRCMLEETQETVYIKVHEAWRRNHDGESLFPANFTAGVIYVLRNPLDVASSCAHHWGLRPETAVANMCNPEFTLARSQDKLDDQLRQPLNSWSGHVLRWLDDSGLPVCLVRYEELHRNPEKVLGELVRFAGLPWDAHRAHKAVRFSSFSELQCQERRCGFRERPPKSSAPFFRRGLVGTWQSELSPALAQEIIREHGEVMRRFGYLDYLGKPAFPFQGDHHAV